MYGTGHGERRLRLDERGRDQTALHRQRPQSIYRQRRDRPDLCRANLTSASAQVGLARYDNFGISGSANVGASSIQARPGSPRWGCIITRPASTRRPRGYTSINVLDFGRCGANRLIFNNAPPSTIYYTNNHYKSFCWIGH